MRRRRAVYRNRTRRSPVNRPPGQVDECLHSPDANPRGSEFSARRPCRSSPFAIWMPHYRAGGAAFVTVGPWAGSLLFTGLRGQALYRVSVGPTNPSAPVVLERHFERQYGRLRDIVEGPDGALYLATSNRDGRGRPNAGDDRLLRLTSR